MGKRQGVDVHSFKSPTVEELDHDFLWRCRSGCPIAGRSGSSTVHYLGDAGGAGASQIPRRAAAAGWLDRSPASGNNDSSINEWEKYLNAQGTKIIEVFLNVGEGGRASGSSRRDTAKNWKFSHGDITKRGYWDDYQKAYSEVLSHTSTESAPWYVVPADKKWFARLATSAILIDALMEIDPAYPELDDEGKSKLDEAKSLLLTELPPEAQPR